MKPIEIKILLMRKGISQRDVSRKLGVSDEAISRTIWGKLKSARLRAGIAKALGKEVTDLWPDKLRP